MKQIHRFVSKIPKWLQFVMVILILLAFQVYVFPHIEKRTRPTIDTGISAFFDCVRENEKILISAHRAGPADRLPENSIAAMANLAEHGMILLEIDVRQSADGVYFLHHDDELGRTAMGAGLVNQMNWSALSKVRLIDPKGNLTPYTIPKLEDVLHWARSQNVILQFDIKRGTDPKGLVILVRDTKALHRVTLISYTDAQAMTLYKLAPEIMISVSTKDRTNRSVAFGSKIPSKRLLGWTGSRGNRQELIGTLNERTIEPIAGTLGALDEQAQKSGSVKVYQDLVDQGAVIFATDRPRAVRDGLHADNDVLRVCPLP